MPLLVFFFFLHGRELTRLVSSGVNGALSTVGLFSDAVFVASFPTTVETLTTRVLAISVCILRWSNLLYGW